MRSVMNKMDLMDEAGRGRLREILRRFKEQERNMKIQDAGGLSPNLKANLNINVPSHGGQGLGGY